MARKLTAAEIFDDVEVDLWDNAYTMRTVTRTIADRLDKAQKKANELDPATVSNNEAAKTLIGLVDILLEPAAGVVTAGKLLTDLWTEDKLGLDWLTAFAEALQGEASARRRPTSPPAKSD